jgi:L-lactate dehydrogenase complex protein LldG
MNRHEAKAEILGRIQEALSTPVSASEVPRGYRRSAPDGTDVVELFAERVADYRAIVHRSSPSGLPDTIARALAARGARRIVAPPGLPAAWLEAAPLEIVADDPPLDHAALDGLDGVVTTCAIAIAETGTIVLDAGPGQGRRALSLLPDVHLCVVDAARIVGSVPEALRELDPHRPLTWISGPSATSDIELSRVEGVHGPRKLDVVIVGPEGRPAGGSTGPTSA